MSLTEDQQRVRDRIAELRESIRTEPDARAVELQVLRTTCRHYVVCGDCKTDDTSDTCPNNAYSHGDAECAICGNVYFGWYCPKSPDHTCHYHSMVVGVERKVQLLDRSYVERPANAGDPEYETDDACLFCGHPDERK